MKKIVVIFGTRPEAIKLCPVILELRAKEKYEVLVCSTGQHREMLDQVLEVFGIIPDVDLAVMQSNQSLASLTSRLITRLDEYFTKVNPDLILVQGDTTTAFCGALTAFYHKIKIGHIEAGLRTWNKQAPWPEEINRTLVTPLADLHFAPTSWSRDNLICEGVNPETIFVTGNTVIDALLFAREKVAETMKTLRTSNRCSEDYEKSPLEEIAGLLESFGNRRLVLITGHRRENFGSGFEGICTAIKELAEYFPDVEFVYPVHLNPNVIEPVQRILLGVNGVQIANIHLLAPQSYLPFVALMDRSYLVLTDSGGVQEEAPSLGKPVFVMRETTERPEAVEAGTAKLIGTKREEIVRNVTLLLTDAASYEAMAGAHNPYGDGFSSARIVEALNQ